MASILFETLPLWAALPFLLALRGPTPDAPSGEGSAEVVEGTAQDAKAGPVLVTAAGEVLYVLGLEAWPEGAAGRAVRVRGTRAEADHVPKATQAADGSWSQGTTGSGLDAVLHAADWSFVPVEGTEPAPWRVVFADLAGNQTTLVRLGGSDVVSWSYEPIQPLYSSSGTYSGGEPAKGEVPAAALAPWWDRLRPAISAGRPLGEGRSKGTGLVMVHSPAGEQNVVIQGSDAEGLDAALVGALGR